MGSSIASQVLMSGLRVTVVEAKSDAADVRKIASSPPSTVLARTVSPILPRRS